MPRYEYRCPNCATSIEVKRAFTDDTPAPMCGDCLVPMDKVIHAAPAIFKGDGWAGKS